MDISKQQGMQKSKYLCVQSMALVSYDIEGQVCYRNITMIGWFISIWFLVQVAGNEDGITAFQIDKRVSVMYLSIIPGLLPLF